MSENSPRVRLARPRPRVPARGPGRGRPGGRDAAAGQDHGPARSGQQPDGLAGDLGHEDVRRHPQLPGEPGERAAVTMIWRTG